MGKFMSQADLAFLRRQQDIFNARLKRGEIDKPEDIVATRQVFCPCGQGPCGFIAVERRDEP